MAQPPTNAKIEELRARYKADPRSRHFYPLGEELRKVGQYEEAEEILRAGLALNPVYLSAWVCLGRVLKDSEKYAAAAEALVRALAIDPGNVVAARLAGEAYLEMGEKVEAIKKFKLARAMLPADEELQAQIERLERELHPIAVAAEDEEEEPVTPTPMVVASEPADPDPFTDSEEAPFELEPTVELALGSAPSDTVESRFFRPEVEEPPGESPASASEPVDYFTDAEVEEVAPPQEQAAPPEEQPFPVSSIPSEEVAPPADEVEDEWPSAEDEAVPVPESRAFASGDELIATETMADLYSRQGHHDSARRIYESLLARDPSNAEVQAKLSELPGAEAAETRNVKAVRLEQWLRKVGRRADGSV
jgi:tetratricopeptide (TPR) repeat protein